MIGCEGDGVLDEWLGNIHFYETMVLKKAKSCKEVKDEDLYSMIRWAAYADRSWSHERLRKHMDMVLREPRAKMRPSKRLVAAFVNNMLIDDKNLRSVIETIARQIPETEMTDFEFHFLLEQRRELKDTLKDLLAPLTHDQDLRHFLKKLLLTDGADVIHEGNVIEAMIKLAIKEDFEKKSSDFSMTKWLTDLFLPTLTCDNEKELLFEVVRNEFAIYHAQNKER